MRTIAHLSDLHFGREDPAAVEALVRDLGALAPSLIAVSGDLTQRARPGEFARARAFLTRLRSPRLVVPGNHDVPLLDLVRRFTAPLERFRAYVSPDPEPVYADDELIVVGISTARSLAWKGGRISWDQMERVRAVVCGASPARLRVLVAHHPFSAAEGAERDGVVGRADHALAAFAGCGLDLILSGHLHRRSVHGIPGGASLHRTVLALHAGTAVSRRLRREENSYNLLRVLGDVLEVETRALCGAGFAGTAVRRFRRTGAGWQGSEAGADDPGALGERHGG